LTESDIWALTELIQEEMQPALGVTEPGAIAFAVAKARSYLNGEAVHINLSLSSGIYKNAFTCGIPNSDKVGSLFAAALGFVAGNSEENLKSLSDVTLEDNKKAQALLDAGMVEANLSGIAANIFIEAEVTTTEGVCCVTIREKHTNIVKIVLNGKIIYEHEQAGTEKGILKNHALIHSFTLRQFCDYADQVNANDIAFIRNAYDVNLELFVEGLNSPRTTFAKYLYHMNGNRVISDDELATAQLLCNAAIEARVLGLSKPAMSITGSGAHGIICTMPLFALFQINSLPEEKLLRATSLSYLITMYIKEYSGRLSAFCGCAIAAGTGMACALVYLKNGLPEDMKRTVNNMASGITGMICDGGNQGCTMKGIVAVDAAFRSVRLAMEGISIADIHGINGSTPESTFRNMGRIASPGMSGTEKIILEIFKEKMSGSN